MIGGERVVALVPCKDGAPRIQSTVRSLAGCDEIDEVVVIDDGSLDETTKLAREAGARVIRLRRNMGKGAALTRGVVATPDAGIFLLVDADTADTAAGAASLLGPVASGEVDLNIGVLPSAEGKGGFGSVKKVASRGIARACGFQAEAPLSGQRAVRASLLRSLKLAPRFGVEVGMTIDAVRSGSKVAEQTVRMDHRHTGRSLAGFAHRGRQGADVVRALAPRLLPRWATLVLTLALLAALCGGVGWVGKPGEQAATAVQAPAGVKVVLVPGLQWPSDSEWTLPAGVSAGSVVTGPTNGPARTAATGKSHPQPNDQALVEVEVQTAEQFAQGASLSASPGQILFVAGFTEPGQRSQARPLLMLGSASPPGELTSASTKRAGLVDLKDLAATASGGGEGRPVAVDSSVAPSPASFAVRADLYGFYDDNNPRLIVAYVAFGLVVAAVALWRWRRTVAGLFHLAPWMLAFAAVPAASFLLRWPTAGIDRGPWIWSALLAVLVGIIVFMAGRRAVDWWVPLRRIALLTIGVIGLDVLTGAHLQQSGFLGSSPTLGTRYYGLGNPSTTLLLLAAITWTSISIKTSSLDGLRPVRRTAAMWIFVAAVIGLPGLGADAGGLLAAVVVGIVCVAAAAGIRLGAKRLVAAGGIALLAGVVAAVSDAQRSASDRTHLGNLAADVGESGFGPLLDTAGERLSNNVFGYGFPFTLLLVVAVVALIGLLLRGRMRSVLPHGSPERFAVLTCLAAALGVWATNDSGVVVLALSAVFVVPLVMVAATEVEEAALLEVNG